MELKLKHFDVTVSDDEAKMMVEALKKHVYELKVEKEKDKSYNPTLDERIENARKLRNSFGTIIGITFYGD